MRHVRYIPHNMWQNLSLFAIHGTPIIVIQLMTVAKIKIAPQNSAARSGYFRFDDDNNMSYR